MLWEGARIVPVEMSNLGWVIPTEITVMGATGLGAGSDARALHLVCHVRHRNGMNEDTGFP